MYLDIFNKLIYKDFAKISQYALLLYYGRG